MGRVGKKGEGVSIYMHPKRERQGLFHHPVYIIFFDLFLMKQYN